MVSLETPKTWVLLRGLVRERRHWAQFPECLQKRFPGCRILSLDVPGNGEKHQEKSPTSVTAMAQNIAQQLKQLQTSSDEALGVMGISLGGLIAWELARQQLAISGGFSIHSLVLINSSFGGLSRPWDRLQISNWPTIFKIAIDPRPLRREEWILTMTTRQHSPLPAAFASRWAEMIRERPVSLSNAVRQIMAAASFRPEAAPLPGVSVLVVNGAGDRLVSPECSHKLARSLQAPIIVHPQAGHDLPLEEPEWLAEQIFHWLNSR